MIRKPLNRSPLSPNQPIEVSFTWDENHYTRAIRAVMRSPFQLLITSGVLIFACYLLYTAGAIAWNMDPTSVRGWLWFLVYLALGGMMIFLRGPLKWIWIKRRFRSRPDQAKQVRYVFDDDGIRGETEGLAKSDIKWEMPVKAAFRGDDLLIYLTPRQTLYIPLDETPQRAELESLVREKIATIEGA